MYPPQFPDVIAHHVTIAFGVPYSTNLLDEYESAFGTGVVEAVGFVSGNYIEALVVRVNGSVHGLDTKIFHITLSLNRSMGVKPVDSNKLLETNTWNTIEPLLLSGSIVFI
jgi:hypothetical protein